MTRPITYGARVDGVWFVCVLGRFGSGATIEEAIQAANRSN